MCPPGMKPSRSCSVARIRLPYNSDSIRQSGQLHELRVVSDRGEDIIDPCFPHLLGAYGVIALEGVEVASEHLHRLPLLAEERVDRGQVVGGAKQAFVVLRDRQRLLAR